MERREGKPTSSAGQVPLHVKSARPTERRTPVERSSLPAATSADNVPMKPCPARWEVPCGSRVEPPACSWSISTSSLYIGEIALTCALARMAMEEVRINAEVTSARAMSSSCASGVFRVGDGELRTHQCPALDPISHPASQSCPAHPAGKALDLFWPVPNRRVRCQERLGGLFPHA